jgi:hypothetical protein
MRRRKFESARRDHKFVLTVPPKEKYLHHGEINDLVKTNFFLAIDIYLNISGVSFCYHVHRNRSRYLLTRIKSLYDLNQGIQKVSQDNETLTRRMNEKGQLRE